MYNREREPMYHCTLFHLPRAPAAWELANCWAGLLKIAADRLIGRLEVLLTLRIFCDKSDSDSSMLSSAENRRMIRDLNRMKSSSGTSRPLQFRNPSSDTGSDGTVARIAQFIAKISKDAARLVIGAAVAQPAVAGALGLGVSHASTIYHARNINACAQSIYTLKNISKSVDTTVDEVASHQQLLTLPKLVRTLIPALQSQRARARCRHV